MKMAMINERLLFMRERGQSLTELAVSMTFILILLAGVVDIGRAFFTYIALRDAAQEASLYGSIEPTNCSGIEYRARNSSDEPVNLADTSLVGVDIEVKSSSCPAAVALKPCYGDEIRVTVRYDNFPITMPFIGSFIGKQTVDISASVSDTVIVPSCSP